MGERASTGIHSEAKQTAATYCITFRQISTCYVKWFYLHIDFCERRKKQRLLFSLSPETGPLIWKMTWIFTHYNISNLRLRKLGFVLLFYFKLLFNSKILLSACCPPGLYLNQTYKFSSGCLIYLWNQWNSCVLISTTKMPPALLARNKWSKRSLWHLWEPTYFTFKATLECNVLGVFFFVFSFKYSNFAWRQGDTWRQTCKYNLF